MTAAAGGQFNELGILQLQDHSSYIRPVDQRFLQLGARLEQLDPSQDKEVPKRILSENGKTTLGDVQTFAWWEPDTRPWGAWSPAFPAVLVSAKSGSPKPFCKDAAKTKTAPKRGIFGQAKLKPLRDSKLADERFTGKDPNVPHALAGTYPKGWTGIWHAGTEEDRQEEIFHPDALGLVAVNYGGDPKHGTRVFDVGDDGGLHKDLWRELHSIFTVVNISKSDCKIGKAIGLNLGQGGRLDGGAGELVLVDWTDCNMGSASARHGGPLTLDHDKGCIHKGKLGTDEYGNDYVPPHLQTNTLFKQGARDGPLAFGGEYKLPNVYGGPYNKPVYLRWRSYSFPYTICGKTWLGRWDWQTDTFLQELPPWDEVYPPPRTPYPPPKPPPPEDGPPPHIPGDPITGADPNGPGPKPGGVRGGGGRGPVGGGPLAGGATDISIGRGHDGIPLGPAGTGRGSGNLPGDPAAGGQNEDGGFGGAGNELGPGDLGFDEDGPTDFGPIPITPRRPRPVGYVPIGAGGSIVGGPAGAIPLNGQGGYRPAYPVAQQCMFATGFGFKATATAKGEPNPTGSKIPIDPAKFKGSPLTATLQAFAKGSGTWGGFDSGPDGIGGYPVGDGGFVMGPYGLPISKLVNGVTSGARSTATFVVPPSVARIDFGFPSIATGSTAAGVRLESDGASGLDIKTIGSDGTTGTNGAEVTATGVNVVGALTVNGNPIGSTSRTTLDIDSTAVTITGTTAETSGQTYTVAADTLAADGDLIFIEGTFTVSGAGSMDDLNFDVGGTTIDLIGGATSVNGTANFAVKVVRTGVGTQDIFASVTGAYLNSVGPVAGTEDETASIPLILRADPGATSKTIVHDLMVVAHETAGTPSAPPAATAVGMPSNFGGNDGLGVVTISADTEATGHKQYTQLTIDVTYKLYGVEGEPLAISTTGDMVINGEVFMSGKGETATPA